MKSAIKSAGINICLVHFKVAIFYSHNSVVTQYVTRNIKRVMEDWKYSGLSQVLANVDGNTLN